MKFLLQREKNGFIDADVCTIDLIIKMLNRWAVRQAESHDISYASLPCLKDKIVTVSDPCVLPVGSLEFCTEVAKNFGVDHIPALNIPESIPSEYVGRDVAVVPSEDELLNYWNKHQDGIIVKPADIAKRFEASEITKDRHLRYLDSRPGPYFVSELFRSPIVSEWRVFFREGRIVDARPYVLDKWTVPDRIKVEKLLEDWKDQPPVGTLDFAVLDTGETYLLEVHPFISCGLYGFEDSEILWMLRDGWKWLLEQK